MSDQSDAPPYTSSPGFPPRENIDGNVQSPEAICPVDDVLHHVKDSPSDHGSHDDSSKSESGSQKSLKPKYYALDDAEGNPCEPLPEGQDLQKSLGQDVEGLETLWDRLPPPQTGQDDEDLGPVDLDVVVVHGFFGTRQLPWENPGGGCSNWLDKWRNRDCKIMSFGYDASDLLSGIHTQKSIRSLAIKLLEDLKSERQQSNQKRTILIVAHDLGGIIVKDALTVSGLKPAQYAEIFDFTRLLVFYGCPHRCLNESDMEDKLNRFLYRPDPSGKLNSPLVARSSRDLARAVVDINHLYIDSKHILRAYIFSIFAQSDVTLDKVFDHYTSTMGVPFEVPVAGGFEDDSGDVGGRVSRMSSSIRLDINSIENERMLLSAASPLSSLRSGPGPGHPFAWISNDEEYKSWYNQRKPQLLYVFGSFDTQSASEYIFYDLDKLHQRLNGQVVVYFSFDRYDIRRNHIRNMLATIQVQILGHFPSLVDTFRIQFAQHRRDRSLHYKDLLHWFEWYKCTGEVEGISCVFNNFDECEPTSRKSFLDQLRYISQTQEPPLRVLVTSRQPRALLEEVSDWPALDLDRSAPQSNQNSSAMSCESLSKVHSNARIFRSQAKLEIRAITELESDVQNLILHHVVEDERWPSETSIRDIFGPSETITLESVVSRILDNVPDEIFVIQTLTLALYAVRPPTVWELAATVHIMNNDNASDLSSSLVATNDVRKKIKAWLAGIITLSQAEIFISTDRIRQALLAELSNTAGLSRLAGCLTPQVAHENIARYCLHYLSSERAKVELEALYNISQNYDTHFAILCDRTSLLDYATQFWMHHLALSIKSIAPDDKVTQMLESFHESGAESSWCRAHWVLANPLTRSRQPAESMYPLLAGKGLAAQAENWCSGERDILAALIEASFNGSRQTLHSLLPKLRYSVESLQEALIGAGAFADEAAWAELIAYTRENYPEFPWVAQVSLVCRASWLEQETVLSKLLEVGCPADGQSADLEMSALYRAIAMNNVSIAKVLLEHGANPRRTRPGGITLVEFAAQMGHADMIRLLAEYGVDLNAIHGLRMTAMYHACLWGNYQAVEALLSLGADPNIKATGNQDDPAWSPNLGLLGICQDLLDLGVDPNNHPGSPPMLVGAATSAKSNNRLSIIKLLIDKGTHLNDVDKYGQTALWYTCLLDDPQMLEIATLLLEHGAHVNHQSQWGATPLHIAAYRGKVDLLQLLVKSPGVNLNVLDNQNQTPLHVACNNEELVKILLEAGAEPNAEPAGAPSVLYRAIIRGLEEVVRLLVQYGARIHNPNGETSQYEPMEVAVIEGRSNILRILADGGGDVNRRFADNYDRTVLFQAIDSDALRALLEFGPKLNIQDDNGYAPLHLVMRSTPVENVKLLVRAGADINLLSKWNTTPLLEALSEGNEAVADYLLSKNADTGPVSQTGGGGPLHAACRWGWVSIIKKLIERKVDVNLVLPGQWGSPLSTLFSYFRGTTSEIQTEILNVLIEAGADVTKPSGLIYGTVGVAAAWGGVEEHISKLASEGASFVARDTMGRLPLHIAAVRGDIGVFTAILNAGTEPSARDNAGRSIVSWAVQGGNIELFEKALQLVGDEAINEQDITGWTPLCWAARGSGTYRQSLDHDNQQAMISALLRKGANKSIRSKITGKEYTPEGIAIYHNRDERIIELLALHNGKGDGIPARPKQLKYPEGDGCDFCLLACWGVRHYCSVCQNVVFCYKCYEVRDKIHPSDHELETVGPEFELSSDTTSSHHSSPSQSTSESSSTSSSSDAEEASGDEA
ncbi:ankyrin repeat-containing domain protein [Xylaria arbuscula]|nr:ankyrin repeat-containing domain protein [Xylaria arbuscula]